MLDKFKVMIEHLKNLAITRMSLKSTNTASVFLEKAFSSEIESAIHSANVQIHEGYTMVKTTDLLSSIEEVISDEFWILKTSDTLSDALALMTLQNVSDIIIVDSNNKFAGIVSDLSIITELPPPVSDVPLRYQLNFPQFHKQVSRNIVNMIQKNIGEVFKLNRNIRRFSKDEFLTNALQELTNPYRTYLDPRIIPILNEDETVAGLVSCETVLKYVRINLFLMEEKVERFLLDKSLRKEPYILKPDDTLTKAYFVMQHLPIDHILICDNNNKLLGMVERYQISAYAHPLYYPLMDIPLREIMKSVDNLYLVESSQPIKEIISSFLDQGIKAAIAVDKSSSQLCPLQVITPMNILQFFRQNFYRKL